MSNETIYNSKFRDAYPDIDLSEYFEFIEKHRLQKSVKFQTANHHILPKWAFPQYRNFRTNPWNKVILQHKDHLEAHFFLWKNWRHVKNASPLLLMLTDEFKCVFTEENIDNIKELYEEACSAHAKEVSFQFSGKTKSDEHKKNLSISRKKDGKYKGLVNCEVIETGEKITVSSQEYKENKNLYKRHNTGKPAWNSGIKGGPCEDLLSVYIAGTDSLKRIQTEEYKKNKDQYTHPSKGKTGTHDHLCVRDILSGDYSRIQCEEYEANRKIYEFVSVGKKWYNNGEINLRFSYGDQIPEGFVSGRKPNSLKGFKKSVVTCPHCGITGGRGNLTRYHFDKCKLKK